MSKPLPTWYPADKDVSEVEALLLRAYNKYVADVSAPEHAMALKAAAFACVVARNVGAKRILDLGSGWTSYALRRGTPATVVSVETDYRWWVKTRDFLRSRSDEIGIGQLLMYHDLVLHLRNRTLPQFDVAVHDMGNMAERATTLSMALALAPVVVLDDLHVEGYPGLAASAARLAGYDLIASPSTVDQYGRYIGVAFDPRRAA